MTSEETKSLFSKLSTRELITRVEALQKQIHFHQNQQTEHRLKERDVKVRQQEIIDIIAAR